MTSLATKNKPIAKRRLTRWFGEFDWRNDYSRANQYWRFETEEELLASMSAKHRQNYLDYRAIRRAKWEASKRYQRCLRITRIRLKKLEKEKQSLLNKRYKKLKLDDGMIPAEAVASIHMAIFLNEVTKESK